MNDQPLLTERRDRVLLITLNRPDARNAVNLAMAEAMAAALDELDGEDELSVGVIAGEGKGFSSGMDLKGFLAGENPTAGGRGFAGITGRPPVTPIVAAVEGYALAGGFEIALACDLIVASEEATFGLPEVTRGLVAAAGGLFRLPRRVPYHLAMEIALTGGRVPAARLHQAGLISALVPVGEALGEARALAAKVAANAPLAVAATKRIIVESADWPSGEAFDRQNAISGPVFTSADAREGAAAFAQKRPPVWRGE